MNSHWSNNKKIVTASMAINLTALKREEEELTDIAAEENSVKSPDCGIAVNLRLQSGEKQRNHKENQ
ncbi:unnamed protein product [Lathyrus oleraceus]